MSDEVRVLEFRIEYPSLNLELQKEKPYLYEFSLLMMNAIELKKGFKVKKILKPTKECTKVTYEGVVDSGDIKTQHDILEKRLKDLLKEYNWEDIYKGVVDGISAFQEDRDILKHS